MLYTTSFNHCIHEASRSHCQSTGRQGLAASIFPADGPLLPFLGLRTPKLKGASRHEAWRAAHVGCGAAEDKLQCLRGVPAANLTAATALTPSFLGYKVCGEHLSLCIGHALTWHRHQGMGALQWFPHADGTLLGEPVRDAALAGKIANVPFIVG